MLNKYTIRNSSESILATEYKPETRPHSQLELTKHRANTFSELNLARQFGADAVLSIESLSPIERTQAIRDQTEGRGADVTIEASGNPCAIPEGLQMTRDNGTYVVVGQYTDNGPVEINPHLDINKKHIDVRGCWGCDFSHLFRAIALMGRYAREFPWELAISAYYGLSQAQRALDDVEQLKVDKAVIDPTR